MTSPPENSGYSRTRLACGAIVPGIEKLPLTFEGFASNAISKAGKGV
jgi:hypothetical protein